MFDEELVLQILHPLPMYLGLPIICLDTASLFNFARLLGDAVQSFITARRVTITNYVCGALGDADLIYSRDSAMRDGGRCQPEDAGASTTAIFTNAVPMSRDNRSACFASHVSPAVAGAYHK